MHTIDTQKELEELCAIDVPSFGAKRKGDSKALCLVRDAYVLSSILFNKLDALWKKPGSKRVLPSFTVGQYRYAAHNAQNNLERAIKLLEKKKKGK